MIHLPEIKTAELSTYRNFAKCHQAHFHVSRVGLGTRLLLIELVQACAGTLQTVDSCSGLDRGLV